MNIRRLLFSGLLIGGLTGCDKWRDYLQPDTEVPDCRVVAITDQKIFPDETYYERITWVEYNEAGNPVNVTEYEAHYDGHWRYVNEMPNPHLYDEQNRLVEEGSSIGNYRHLSRYVYEGDSELPVRDTLYVIDAIYVEHFEYDAAGRITRLLRHEIKEGEHGLPHPNADLRYYYDIRGNRQEHPSNPGYNGVIRYTDRPSLYSLHPVWQLRYRDYSRNATQSGEAYNEQGLPTKYSDSSATYFQPFLNAAPGATIQYDCE